MQLKFQRSQRVGGVLGKTVIFCLDVRAEYSPTEAANIAKYKLGGEVVYNSQAAKRHLENMNRHLSRVDNDSAWEKGAGLARGVASLALATMNLNISIASLGRGHHIECKDLPELLDAEKTLMDACRDLKQFLAAAATFNGSVILVDFDDGEKIHISQGALELEALPAPSLRASAPPSASTYQPQDSPLSYDGLSPTDLAQMQFGNTEDLFAALFGENINQFRTNNPWTFWLCIVGGFVLLLAIFLSVVQ